MKVMILLDWVAQKYHNSFAQSKADLNLWKDMLVGIGFGGQTPRDWFTSANYYALLQPVIEMHRTTQQLMEFLHILAMVHGQRCLYTDLRDNLGYAVIWAAKLSEEVHKLELSGIYNSQMSLFEESTDVLRHLLPTIDVLTAAAKFADAFAEVRLSLDKLAVYTSEGVDFRLPDPSPYPSPLQDAGGAFLAKTFIVRNLTNGWHLDYALGASLIRLWPPPPGHGDGCHTSIADFGAGGGHYCKFFNKTDEYCCSSFDGAAKASLYTNGAVQTQRLDEYFDLGRRFDWILCLEVLEHIPEAKEDVALANLRRHALKGLVVSWSEHGGDAHPNAKPWSDVQQLLKDNGFILDPDATRSLRTQVSWLKDAVHVFRVM